MDDSKAPEELRRSIRWLRSVFPEGIADQQYSAVLTALYPEYSDRHRARLMVHLTGRDDAAVFNDVLRVAGEPPSEAITQVRQLLTRHGFPDALDDS